MTRQSHHADSDRATIRIGVRVVICVAMAIVQAGCKSTPRAAELDQAVGDYQAKRYAMAQKRAVRVQRSLRGPRGGDAAYLAGLCAYQLGDLGQAEQWLTTAARSSHRLTVGKAKAALGLVLMDQHRPHEAAGRLKEAAGILVGVDARLAAYHAAMAYQQAGDEASADRWFKVAGGDAGIDATDAASRPILFTLQAGAFRHRRHAERVAGDVSRVAMHYGLSAARIVPSRDQRGQTLYLVQFGRFRSRSAAAAARSDLGKLQYIVALLTTPNS
ncbi:MAG: SPOR domain-containing protein [Planctomycetes bacterium]|nr:SPOR domain-containing protein [Planctomycetota bacterium]